MADIITEVTREIRRTNPAYNQFMFDKTEAFLKATYANRKASPKGAYANRHNLLYIAGIGFLTGYGAAIDGEYDENRTEPVPSVAETDCWQGMRRLLNDDGVSPHPYTLARASVFVSGSMRLGVPEPALYYSGYGFVIGFEQGLEGLSTGEVAYIADDAEQQARIEELVTRVSRRAAYETILENGLRVDMALGAYDDYDDYDDWDDDEDDWDDDEDDWDDDEDDDEAEYEHQFDDDEWAVLPEQLDATGTLMHEVAAATHDYVTATSCGRSGWGTCSDEILGNRAQTYANHFIEGLCDQAFGDIPDTDSIAGLAGEVDGLFAGFSGEPGADYEIEHSAKLGLLQDDDVTLAKAGMRHIMDVAVAAILGDDDIEQYDEENPLILPIPDPSDSFWHIAGIAYANGVRKAINDDLHVSDRNHAAYDRLMDEIYCGDLDYDEEVWDEDDDGGIATWEVALPDGYEEMSLVDRFFALGNQNGGTVDSWMEAIGILNASLVTQSGFGDGIDPQEVIRLRDAVNELCRITPRLRKAVDANWGPMGGPLLVRMADALESGLE